MAKILVLDDEDDLREVITEELNDVGHTPVDFAGGQAALDYLANEPIDLILSDITMPKMTGYQFFRAVKEQFPQHADTPFIFMTALSDRSNELKGLRLGADDYITKPIDFDLMLLRVEGHLRRRQPAAAPAPVQAAAPAASGQAMPSSQDAEAPANESPTAAALRAILKARGGQVIACQFSMISADDLQARLGDAATALGERIRQETEAAIHAHLGPNDGLLMTPDHGFLAFFAEIDDDEVKAKSGQIRDDIWERLFALSGDPDIALAIANVDVQAHELSLDAQIDGGELLQSAFRTIQQAVQDDIDSKKKQLEQIFSFERFLANPLLVPTGSPSKIKALSFSKKNADRVEVLSALGPSDGPFLLDLMAKMFERLKEMPNSSKAFAKSAMLLPIPFSLLRDTATREGLIALLKDLEDSMGLILVIEITGTPDRLKPYQDILKPLPVGRKLQFVEIRRPRQADGLALGDLGVAYVSMNYGDIDVMPTPERADFVNDLKRQGVNLYVKNIPEGKLVEAQGFDAKLLSMMK
jgi:DNA-binding response OmpR family regulator